MPFTASWFISLHLTFFVMCAAAAKGMSADEYWNTLAPTLVCVFRAQLPSRSREGALRFPAITIAIFHLLYFLFFHNILRAHVYMHSQRCIGKACTNTRPDFRVCAPFLVVSVCLSLQQSLKSVGVTHVLNAAAMQIPCCFPNVS